MRINELAAKVEQLMHAGGRRADGISKHDAAPGLFLFRRTAPSGLEATIYEPVICLILQGEKQTIVGDRTVRLRAGEYVVFSHALPVSSQITLASESTPYLALVIQLDMAVLRSLYDQVGEAALQSKGARCVEVAPAEAPIIDVMARYVSLIDNPVETRVLAPLVRKELHFRLLMSKSGAMLRSLLNRGSHASNIARAIDRLRSNFRDNLEVADLARSVGMSASSFHKHFKEVTLTTPLQYQKDLRLTEARRLIWSGMHSVTTAAFEVGYESPSQFSREYSRKFGAPPREDLRISEASQ